MCKYQVITSIICIMTFLYGMSNTHETPSAYLDGALPDISKTNLALTNDGDLIFKSFEVSVAESDEYYAEFWVLPAKYADGTYTKFNVYVNDEFIGYITPDKGNWQSARIKSNERIGLRKGNNIIKVAVPAPEIPSVETIQIAHTDSEATISSEAYEEFLNKASVGKTYDIPEEECVFYSNTNSQSSNIPEFAMKHFFDVPLKYTFYNHFIFKEGETVQISTSSLSEHDVDVLYLGKLREQISFNSGIGQTHLSSDVMNNDDQNNPRPLGSIDLNYPVDDRMKPRPTYSYTSASAYESQGINWKGLSMRSNQDQTNRISKFIKIPKTGVYLIRLRHRESGKTGIANLYVNGKYTYDDVPISFSWVECEMPANGKEYGTMTVTKEPIKEDPILFIHGAAGDRIVGFNDDAPADMRTIHNLTNYDSHILQNYHVKTSGISVSSYTSKDPESKCEIIAGVDESIFDLGPDWQPKPKGTPHQSGLNNQLSEVTISNPLAHSGVVTITSKTTIHNVKVSDLSGTIISNFHNPGTEFSVSKDQMKIKAPGIYIISVETDNGIVSKKLFFD